RLGALRVVERKAQGDGAACRVTERHDPLGADLVSHLQEIRGEIGHGIRPRRTVRVAVAAQVPGDGAAELLEGRYLEPPGVGAGRNTVRQNQGRLSRAVCRMV